MRRPLRVRALRLGERPEQRGEGLRRGARGVRRRRVRAGPAFSDDKIDGSGASASESLTYGAYLTTDQLGFEFGDLTTTLTGNSIQHDGTGANGQPGTVVDAQNTWWGCKQGPNNSAYCDTAVGTVNYTPWPTSMP